MGGAVFDLFAKLTLDSSEYEKGLEGAKGKGNSFASFLGTVGKVGAAAFAAIGTATAAIGTQAVGAYKDYEQLYGGIQKLFGEENVNVVAQYAERAFLTSGKSINEYYSSVSQITSSLKRSIGDDMNEVARVADIAMQVISDNVNTFGSDAEFVENAIMGLSRQNYTMIDNLKLGYAGTAQGMLELINDSGVLGKTLKDTSELANVGFDQMIMAIQKVQEEQGIAGTTAKEALRTIEGSAKATKSAWQNVLTAIGRGEGLEEALSGLSTAIFGNGEEGTGFLNQIIPRIQTTMESIGTAITQAAPILAAKIPQVLKAIIPTISSTVVNLTRTLVSFIQKNMPSLVKAGIDMLNWIANGIAKNFPAIIQSVVKMISSFLGAIVSNLPSILAAGAKIIANLLTGIVNSIPSVISAVVNLVQQAGRAFINYDWAGLGRNIIDGVVNGIWSFASRIGDALQSIAGGAWKRVKNFFGIASPSKLMRDTVGKFIPLGIAEGIEDAADSVYKAMDNLSVGTIDAYDPIDVVPAKVGSPGSSTNYGGVVINVYPTEGMDEEVLAENIMRRINRDLRKEQMIYG